MWSTNWLKSYVIDQKKKKIIKIIEFIIVISESLETLN